MLLVLVVIYVISIPYFLWFFKDLGGMNGNDFSFMFDKSLIHMILVTIDAGMRNGGGVADKMNDKYRPGTDGGEGGLDGLLAFR